MFAAIVLASAGCVGPGQPDARDRNNQSPDTAQAQHGRLVPEAVIEGIHRGVNEVRAQNGQDPLATDQRLGHAARALAGYMARTDEYGHRADGRTPPERARAHGYELCRISENIAYVDPSDGTSSSAVAKQFVTGWANSTGHRENMLHARVTETGIAVDRSEDTGYWYAVQLFGRPISMRPTFKIANRSTNAVRYELAGERFQLEPGVRRTHRICDPGELYLLGDGAAQDSRVQPDDGDRYVVVQGDDGPRLEPE